MSLLQVSPSKKNTRASQGVGAGVMGFSVGSGVMGFSVGSGVTGSSVGKGDGTGVGSLRYRAKRRHE
eukprot:scaffold86992_cov70-Cyclotella_meneghiniana.AAC.9